jgi:hypothetical protein
VAADGLVVAADRLGTVDGAFVAPPVWLHAVIKMARNAVPANLVLESHHGLV